MTRTTVAEGLVALLAAHDVGQVFGIPGNHTVPLYRHLAAHGVKHVTCRHEQGAAFMADGFARACGTPGVCLLISGPGLTNAATGIAQARADSVPMLVISAVAPLRELGLGHGTLHELPDQRTTAQSLCRSSHTLLHPDTLPELVERAFAAFRTQRPGPIHIEIPLDLMDAPLTLPDAIEPVLVAPPAPDPVLVVAAAARLMRAREPVLIVGGGAADADRTVTVLAQVLDCPVLNTVNGKGVVAANHPLAVGGSPSLHCLRRAIIEADAVLAIGTEFSETDFDLLMTGPLPALDNLIRMDLDPEQLIHPIRPALAMVTDAASGARALEAALLEAAPTSDGPPQRNGAARAAALRAAVRDEAHYHPEMAAFFEALDRAAPEALIVGDSTRPTYYAAWQLERTRPRHYFHSVSGYGTLGYALPAAIGARLARSEPVLCLIGDGGLQFTLPELSTAAELELPLPVIVWQNQGYREIENSMRAAGVPADSTHIRSPDLEAAARAHRANYGRPTTLEALTGAIETALAHPGPTLIEVEEDRFLSEPSGGWYE